MLTASLSYVSQRPIMWMKRLVKSPKLYFRDEGVLYYLTNINKYDEWVSHSLAGVSWEGYVIKQIMGRVAGKGYYYQTQIGAEVDLCLVRGNKPVAAFEIKLSTNPSTGKGNTEAIQDLGTNHNFIITPSDSKSSPQWQVCSLKSAYLAPLKLLK